MWVCGRMAIGECGGMWTYGHSGVWVYGRMAIGECVGMWTYGHWGVCGYMDVWP